MNLFLKRAKNGFQLDDGKKITAGARYTKIQSFCQKLYNLCARFDLFCKWILLVLLGLLEIIICTSTRPLSSYI